MFSLDGKKLLVIGGGSMGSEVCRSFAAAGASVYFTYRTREQEAATLAGEIPPDLLAGYDRLDLMDVPGVQQLIDSAASKMGGIDVLVVTAGYVHNMLPIEEIEFVEVERTIGVELLGVIAAARFVLPHMRETGFGRIVIVGSDSGKVGSTGEAASSAARGGVIAFAKALARETARQDITVNVVCPGPTEGPMLDELLADPGVTGKLTNAMMRAIPKKRAAKTSEIAATVAFLASAEAAMVTGQAVSVSGGLTMQ